MLCSDNMNRWPYIRFAVAIALLLLTLWFGFQAEPSEASDFVRHYGYWYTALSGIGFIAYLGMWLISSRRGDSLDRIGIKFLLIGLVAVLAGAVVVFHGSDLDYKILMDDYLLTATAKSLHETGEVSVADFGREIDGQFTVIQSFVDKRPWFYPFLVSIAHDTFGYHSVHPFVINAVLAVAFLAVVFIIGRTLGGLGGGILSVLLWASLPLLQQNATGGGMEMLNLLMIQVVILLSIFYLRSPSAKGEGALCLAGILLTYSRYESGLFLPAILLVIVIGWWKSQRVFLSLPAICAAPLLLAVFLQTRSYAATESSWELADGVAAPFALSHLWQNIPHALAFFWSRDPAIANSILLGLLALPALVGFAYLCFGKRKTDWWKQPANQVWVIFAAFLLLNLIVVLCFHAAQFDKRYVARYSLPTHGLIVFSTVACLACLRPKRWIWLSSIVLTTLSLLVVTSPKNAQALYTKANFMIAEQHWLEAFDSELMEEGALVIDRFNTAWTLRERAALSLHIALSSGERIKAELVEGKYSQLYLVERLIEKEGTLQAQLPAADAFKKVFQVELIQEESFRVGTLTRVYRLKP